jgi:hypothetical protein
MTYQFLIFFKQTAQIPSHRIILLLYIVGASLGNLPHVKNFDDQATLMQIGILATA